MPILAWVGVGLFAAAVGAVAAFGVWFWQQSARLTAHGEDVVAAIMMANDALAFGKPRRGADYRPAQVVFTLDGDTSDGHIGMLQEYMKRLSDFEPDEGAGFDERVIGQVLRTHIPYSAPLRFPDRLTGGAEVYTASVNVYWDLLPGGRLTLPYIHCRVLVEGRRDIRMIASPKRKRSKKR